MPALHCDICQKELQQPGGLVFSPPTNGAWLVEKYHVCAACWPELKKFVSPQGEPIAAPASPRGADRPLTSSGRRHA